ncbi:hypothetical protein ACH4F6_01925 [Streptomyces sp. NPDC017936]|uniref:hypothetical protein n=1 Tax=Streptomyces sp. NPDC017936 TaxID=3365016 RepID=UPI0037B4933B
MSIRVTHPHGEHVPVAAATGTEVLRHVHRPGPEAFASRTPRARPPRPLAGRTVTGHRPHGHRDDRRAGREAHRSVRSGPVPTAAFPRAFSDEFAPPPGKPFAFLHRLVLADGARDHDRVAGHPEGLPW